MGFKVDLMVRLVSELGSSFSTPEDRPSFEKEAFAKIKADMEAEGYSRKTVRASRAYNDEYARRTDLAHKKLLSQYDAMSDKEFIDMVAERVEAYARQRYEDGQFDESYSYHMTYEK